MKKNKIALLLAGVLTFSVLGSSLQASASERIYSGEIINLKGIHYDQEGFNTPTNTKGKLEDVADGIKIKYSVVAAPFEEVTGVEIRRNGETLGFMLGAMNEYVDKKADKSKNNKYEIIPVERRSLRVGTSLVLESKPEVIKNYIDVNGVNYAGTKETTAMRINLDYTDNTMYLTNRKSEDVIHAGLGRNKYFEFTLYDKNMNKKKDLTMYANDKAGYVKFNSFNLTKFEIGDYVEVFHKEPFRLTIDGEKQQSQKTLYRVTQFGLVAIAKVDGTTVTLGGSGTGSFDLDFTGKVMSVKNKVKGTFAQEYTGFGNYYIQVILSDKDGKTKAQSNLYGSMFSENIEVDKLNGVRYEYGDILTINHMSPSHISLKGSILGVDLQGNTTQRYKITKEGLKADTTINGTTIHLGGSGTGSFDLEINNKTLNVKNKTDGTFASKLYDYGFYTKYITLMIRDRQGRVKLNSTIYGSMTTKNLEISNINGVKFEYGDIFTIYHRDSEYMSINGPMIGKINPPLGEIDPDDDYADPERTLSFEMTEDALKVIE